MLSRFSRDWFFVILLFAVLIALTVVVAARREELAKSQESFVPYSTYTTLPRGTLALRTWLDAAGYRTQRIEGDAFRVSDNTRVLFIINPLEEFADSEAQAVLRWVERGNTLILVESNVLNREFAPNQNRLLRALHASTVVLKDIASRAALEQPLLDTPQAALVNTRNGLDLERHDFVEYLRAEDKPLLVRITQGKGQVWISSAPFLFSNDGLREPANAALVFALLNKAPRGSVVAFDEYHLGFNSKVENDTLGALLFGTPWGLGIVYAFAVCFAYLAVNGQRFGRINPLPKEIARRNPAEYVTSMAQLFRRAGKREMVLHHYHQTLKRQLARPYQINRDLPDEQFVALLARVRPNLDREKLLETLRALSQSRVSEGELVKLAEQATLFLRKREG